jgi:hypothetical protein
MREGRANQPAIPSAFAVIQPSDGHRVTLPRRKQQTDRISRLPYEILANIFAHVLALSNYDYVGSILKTRTILMLVSHLFHHIMISHQELWSFIPLAGPLPNLPAIDRMISLARNTLLHFHLDLRVEYRQENWCESQMMDRLFDGLLIPRIERVEKLTFIINRSDTGEAILSRLSGTLAPRLKHFKIVCGDLEYTHPLTTRAEEWTSDGVYPFSAENYPQLQYLALHAFPVDCTAGKLDNLTELDLSLQGVIGSSKFIKFIQSLSRLQSLTLRTSGPAFCPPNRQSQPIHLPNIRRLVLGVMEASYIGALLTMFRFSALQELGIHSIYGHMAEEVWQWLSKPKFNQYIRGIQTLEIFDVEEARWMRTAHPHAFTYFISTLNCLKRIRMRKASLDFLDFLGVPPGLHWPLLPALEIIEVCLVVEFPMGTEEELDDMYPAGADVVSEKLVKIIKDRAAHMRRLRILHLDGDEWKSDRRAEFLHQIAKTGFFPPIIHWDARAPFFNDYYDSCEV